MTNGNVLFVLVFVVLFMVVLVAMVVVVVVGGKMAESMMVTSINGYVLCVCVVINLYSYIKPQRRRIGRRKRRRRGNEKHGCTFFFQRNKK